MKRMPFLLCLIVVGLTAFGQKTGYTVVNRRITDDGKGNIYLNAAERAGMAWIKGLAFTEGTIEFDIKGKNVQQQSFVGFAFHGVNDSTYEAVYFRPFNFRSPDAVRKGHAVQYIANPNFDWPVLREKYPNKYEQPVDPVPDPNDWFHAKIAVTAEKIEVFVNGNSKPSLVVKPLVRSGGKLTGFWVGNGSDGDWRNLRVNGVAVIK
ncbi:MAG TPA: hypothetical protein VHE34_12395 [Puia sp.]|uniref:hypothetical protein n=1 Tax=Puia sp. TaxID=2045100 RepID=UPI002CA1165D|nr:hypothetical protein [Puia sp.]HVU96022.1 hypothetical protein [Puia sp.]